MKIQELNQKIISNNISEKVGSFCGRVVEVVPYIGFGAATYAVTMSVPASVAVGVGVGCVIMLYTNLSRRSIVEANVTAEDWADLVRGDLAQVNRLSDFFENSNSNVLAYFKAVLALCREGVFDSDRNLAYLEYSITVCVQVICHNKGLFRAKETPEILKCILDIYGVIKNLIQPPCPPHSTIFYESVEEAEKYVSSLLEKLQS